jgi:hypothetical protein
MNASNADFAPASTLRVSRGSLMNRCPERRLCAIPGEAFLHPHDTAEEVWPGVPWIISESSQLPCGEFMVNVLNIYNVYNIIMPAVKRIPVSEPVWKELGAMKGAGQTYDDLLEDMIDRVKKARLEEDVKMWESCPDSEYVSLSEIKD